MPAVLPDFYRIVPEHRYPTDYNAVVSCPRIIEQNSRRCCIPSGIRTSSDAGLGRTASTINIRISRGTAKDRTHINMLSVLRSGLSSVQNTGRFPVHLYAGKTRRFPAEKRISNS